MNRPDLILDLAKLCIQLKKFDRAEELLNNETFNEDGGNYEKLKQNVEAHFNMYKLHLKRQGHLNLNANEDAKK